MDVGVFQGLPDTQFGAIVIDPPWEHHAYHRDTGRGRTAEAHYPTHSLQTLATLPVTNLLLRDGAVFVWATMPTLPEAFWLIDQWGLRYKTCAFTWVKMCKRDEMKPATGMGFWTRSNAELCLLATKGHPKRKAKDVQQIVLAPRREHSRKPHEIVMPRIERLIDGPYLELFARDEPRPGWTKWGNEVGKFVGALGDDVEEVA